MPGELVLGDLPPSGYGSPHQLERPRDWAPLQVTLGKRGGGVAGGHRVLPLRSGDPAQKENPTSGLTHQTASSKCGVWLGGSQRVRVCVCVCVRVCV